MDAGGGEADHDVTGLDARAVDEPVAVDDADGGAAEVELLLAVDAGQLGRLAAEDRAAGGAADLGGTFDQLGDLLRVDRVRGDVVEEEERLGAGREDVVDAVGGEVGPAPAQLSGAAPEDELRADRVGRGGEQTPVVDREEARERAERARDAGRGGRGDGPTQPVDDLASGGERDACGGVRARRSRAPAPGSRAHAQRATGSNRSFVRPPAGTAVGYCRVKQARQTAPSGNRVASCIPSSER